MATRLSGYNPRKTNRSTERTAEEIPSTSETEVKTGAPCNKDFQPSLTSHLNKVELQLNVTDMLRHEEE